MVIQKLYLSDTRFSFLVDNSWYQTQLTIQSVEFVCRQLSDIHIYTKLVQKVSEVRIPHSESHLKFLP